MKLDQLLISPNEGHQWQNLLGCYNWVLSGLVLPNEPDQPNPPLFITLRGRPDSTYFLTLRVGFNPIQPINPKYFFYSFVSSPLLPTITNLDPLNPKWLGFVIWSGLAWSSFKKGFSFFFMLNSFLDILINIKYL